MAVGLWLAERQQIHSILVPILRVPQVRLQQCPPCERALLSFSLGSSRPPEPAKIRESQTIKLFRRGGIVAGALAAPLKSAPKLNVSVAVPLTTNLQPFIR